MIAALPAVREWINHRADLVGEGLPLALGAYLEPLRSPENGAYAMLWRNQSNMEPLVAEDDRVTIARVVAMVYAGTREASETAACALASAIQSMQGNPARMGGSGVTLMACTYLVGPDYQDQIGGGETFAYQVAADFIMHE